MTRAILTILAGLATFAAGCSGETDTVTLSEAASSSGVEAEALLAVEGQLSGTQADANLDLNASCGEVVFNSVPPNLDEFPAFHDDASPVLAAGDGLAAPTPSQSGVVDASELGYQWSLAFQSDTQRVLFGQDNVGGLASSSFERRDGSWHPTSWGGCNIRIGAPGYSPAKLFLDPSHPADRSSTSLALLISELACSGGIDPNDSRAVVPIVTETATTVEILVLVESPQGDLECGGDAPSPIVVELDTPLSGRTPVDAHVHPPSPIAEQ